MEQRWSSMGYYAYHQKGEVTTGRWDRQQWLGGSVILARKDLQQRLLHKQALGSAQVVLVEVQGWILWSAYAPPRGKQDLLDLLALTLAQVPMDGEKTLIAADWNEEPGGEFLTFWTRMGGEEVGYEAQHRTESTRWSSAKTTGLVGDERQGHDRRGNHS